MTTVRSLDSISVDENTIHGRRYVILMSGVMSLGMEMWRCVEMCLCLCCWSETMEQYECGVKRTHDHKTVQEEI